MAKPDFNQKFPLQNPMEGNPSKTFLNFRNHGKKEKTTCFHSRVEKVVKFLDDDEG
jgi:hypothetical protein